MIFFLIPDSVILKSLCLNGRILIDDIYFIYIYPLLLFIFGYYIYFFFLYKLNLIIKIKLSTRYLSTFF